MVDTAGDTAGEMAGDTAAGGAAGGAQLPERLPYRLLTGTDDRAFCEKVSVALLDGYVLYGSPAVSSDGGRVVTAQAVVLPPGDGSG